MGDPALEGRWGPVFTLPNVAVHASLLPNGRVLFWGRRDRPDGTMDEHECTPQVWNPADGTSVATPQPAMPDGTKVNLFCSGHAFLPDGLLLVAGGHLHDSQGVNQASIYDWRSGLWDALPPMNDGRWYPTATTLPDGSVLVMSGTYLDPATNQVTNNSVPQVWDGEGWRTLNGKVVSLYPRLHLLPDGRVFVAGTDPTGTALDLAADGSWPPAPARAGGDRQYAPSVAVLPGKILFVGGGNDSASHAPFADTEVVDFGQEPPAWRSARPMHVPRRQHNGTILADGTVLVTGGTRGGGFDGGFNDLSPGQPVHEAELWDPATGAWTMLAPETVDRCYHSTALLLPDGTVLSAGGGEYFPNGQQMPPEHVHRDGQVFHPPYLFRGDRPVIERVPRDVVPHGAEFSVAVSGAAVGRLVLVGLGSVTHSFNAGQRFLELPFTPGPESLVAVAPRDGNVCPPGWYMLFALSQAGVPSVAEMVRVGAPAGAGRAAAAAGGRADPGAHLARQIRRRDEEVVATAAGTLVTAGLTSTCPYGLAACWAGAYQTLKTLDGVDAVRPIADAATSTADIYLGHEGVPDVELWAGQFKAKANGSYDIRGFEVTVSGRLDERDGRPRLVGPGRAFDVALQPIGRTEKVQWDWARRAPALPTPDEADAFDRMVASGAGAGGAATFRVTGPLRSEADGPVLYVRSFDAER